MSLSGLYLEPFAYMIPPNPKISKFVWENSQSPAPDAQEPLKKTRPAGLIYSLTCPLRCTNPRLYIWPVGRTVGTYVYPNTKNFKIPVGKFPKSCTRCPRTP